MIYAIVKVLLSAGIIVAIGELAKRSATLGALLASLPLVSLLGMVWLYHDTRDVPKVAALSTDIFWLVLPSLPMFLLLPWLLRQGMAFYLALGLGVVITIVLYLGELALLGKLSS